MTTASELIVTVLTRIPLPPGPITLFKALDEARAPLSRAELAALIRDGDSKSLTGVFSALTNRVNGTPGLGGEKPGYQLLIEKNETRDGVFYSIRPELRDAISRLPG